MPQSFLQESSLSLSFFSFSLTISQFGLLYHVSSLRLSSMHSNPVVTPKQAAHASRFIPSSLLADASIWATSLPGVVLGCMICVCGVFFSLPVMLPFEIPKLPTDPPVRGFPGVWKLLLHNSPPGRVSIPNSSICLYLLHFVLPPFKENGLPFWVLGVLRQRSEVVLWNLLNVQMIF